MALQVHSATRTDYPFLAHPPPQKKRPIQPLPSPSRSRPSLDTVPAEATPGPRRRSNTFSAIASWAAHVQPGSPASLSPRSPHRRPSLRKGRVPSASSLHVTPTPTAAFTPTPSVRDFKADLTTVGYTSVFLQFPNTPASAALSIPIRPPSPNVSKSTHVTPGPFSSKPCSFTRFRSLSILRSRSRSKSACLHSPTRMHAKGAAASTAVFKRKKAQYTIRPPPLSNELALMQFVDGGNVNHNIKRIMEVQAKASGVSGLTDVYRDGEGGIWWDQDEEWEYAHLLTEGDGSCPRVSGGLNWVTFGANSLTVGVAGEDRRGSVSTQDSNLDPKYVVEPVDSLYADDLALFGGTVAPLTTRKPPVSVLSLPSRPRRAAQHLRKPGFLVDVAFPHPYASPKSPRSLTSSSASAGMKPKGRARRRPAPLKLSPPSPARKQPTNSPIDAEKARKDFIDASFEPVNLAPVTPVTPWTAVSAIMPAEPRPRFFGNSRTINVPWQTVNDGLSSLGVKRKPSVLNMMGLFRSSRKEDISMV